MTQVQAAEILEVTPQTMRNWETGRNEPPDSAVRKMANLYGLTLERLLDDLDMAVIPVRPMARRSRYNRVIVNPERMSEARRSAGLKLSEVSELTGLGISTISRYEKGRANPGTLTLEVLANIYDRPAGWFTPRGYFTEDERERFEESINPWWEGKEWIDTGYDTVTETYGIARPHLSERGKLKIAKFILFVEAMELSAYGDDLPSAGYPNAAYVAGLKSRMPLSDLL